MTKRERRISPTSRTDYSVREGTKTVIEGREHGGERLDPPDPNDIELDAPGGIEDVIEEEGGLLEGIANPKLTQDENTEDRSSE